MKKSIFMVLVFLFGYLFDCWHIAAQSKTATFGIQIEPIIPIGLFRITKTEKTVDSTTFIFSPKSGYSLGANISVNLFENFCLETGIHITKRNFQIDSKENEEIHSLEFSVQNFEIPISATYYVKLFQNVYMSQTLGVSMQMLPSHLISRNNWVGTGGTNSYFEQLSLRKSWLVPTYTGAIGFELRTEAKGSYYFGPVYHLFSTLYDTQITYKNKPKDIIFLTKSVNDFFGIVFRYNFNPSPLLMRTKKSK